MAGTVETDGTVSKQTHGQRRDRHAWQEAAGNGQTRPILQMKAKYMGNKWKGRKGKYEPQQTDACCQPDECAGQTDEAKDARDSVGQAEEGQGDAQGWWQATVQLEGPEGSRGHREIEAS